VTPAERLRAAMVRAESIRASVLARDPDPDAALAAACLGWASAELRVEELEREIEREGANHGKSKA
jgi:hypothetical protein